MLNKHEIIGHLGADPETRYMPSGDAVTNIRVATTERWKDKASGEMKEATEWHRIAFFGRLAEIAGEYLRKGSLVYVCCRSQTQMYEKDGVKHYSVQIRGDELKMLGGKPECDGGSQGDGQQRQPRQAAG
uniref:single-stranded DNA-binding protein n=1 Tax=Klebsiella pneumoniae TaxID=573 RepID=UPI001E416D72